MAGRSKDPIVRLSKREHLPAATLYKAAQSLFEDKLRFIERVNRLQFDEKPDSANPDAHKVLFSDTAEIRLLCRLWLRYWALDDSGDDNIKACHDILAHIVKVTESVMKQKMEAHKMVMDYINHTQRMQEHADKMAIASRTAPEDLPDAALQALTDDPQVTE